MKKVLAFISALLLYLLPIVASPLHYSVTHYSTEDGLSQNTVMYMMQDTKGMMWMATWDGLNRFDGYHFSVYKALAGDHVNLSNNRIESIEADRYGYIWLLAYDHKVHRFDPRTEHFMPVTATGYEALNIKKITVLPGGSVWLHGENDEAIRVTTNGTTNEIKTEIYSSQSGLFPSQQCFLVHEDSNGNEWILTDNGIGIIQQGENTPEQYFTTSTNADGKNIQAFYALSEDEHNIYIGSDSGRIWSFDKKTKKFELLQLPTTAQVKSINHIPSPDCLFITTEKNEIIIYDVHNKRYEQLDRHNTPMLAGACLEKIFVDSHSEVWIDPGISQEVFHYNPVSRKLKRERVLVEMSSASQTNPYFLILEDNRGTLWVQPDDGGLCYYDREDDCLRPLFQNTTGQYNTNRVHSAYADKQGNLWVCTFSKGVDKISFQDSPFNIRHFGTTEHYSLDNDVRCIFRSHDGSIFVGLRNGETQVFSPDMTFKGLLTKSGKISPYGEKLDGVIYNMVQDEQDRLWIATKGEGLICAEPITSTQYRIKRYKHSADDIYSLSSNSLYFLHIDKNNRLWIATYGGGLNYMELNNLEKPIFINHRNDLRKYPINECDRVRTVGEDSIGNIWVGTTAGAIMFKSRFTTPDSIIFHHYTRNAEDSGSLSANDVHYIYTTGKGDLYLATFGGGLCRLETLDEDNAQFEVFTHANGLPSDVLLAIAEDNKGNLWISTENGLSKFDPTQKKFENFVTEDALLHPRFSEGTVENIGSQITFGSTAGIISFDPDSIKKSDYIPPIYLTRLLVAGKVIEPGKSSTLSQILDETTLLQLKPEQNIFSIQYVAIDMTRPQNIQYAYMLEGFEEEWNYVGSQQTATYTNLPKGKYTFKVKSTNSDGIWCENTRVLTIAKQPSFWETPWAWALYIVTFLLIAGIGTYILITIYRLKNEVSVEQQVSDIKLRFFTNISHELRTPLTLISGPVEHILQDPDLKSDTREQLRLVEKNTDRMLRLVNQILDFRKIQNKKMHLRVSEIDIIPFIKQTMSNFNSLAEEQDMSYDLQSALHECFLWVDTDKLDKILFNLLSNAFKYTPSGKSITVSIEDKDSRVAISVRDEGIGIADNQKSKLFVRFENLIDKNIFNQPTTGIGLSLAKELVEMHKGTIEVESKVGEGSTFTIYLKKGWEHYDETVEYILADLPETTENGNKTTSTENQLAENPTTEENTKATILIVEDNSELLSFLKTIFANRYHVIEACDGIDGVEKAQTHQPDLIISDLMMPNLDGIGLIRELRKELLTSHIPIILLTARSTIESKIAGLEEGADDYITKPFSAAYLQARVENLLQQRIQLRNFYRTNLGTQETDSPIPSLPGVDQSAITQNDRKFLERLLELMEQNMDNGDLVVDDFVHELAVSRSVFFKKLKALTGLAPIEFIREMRIKRAAQLILQGEYTMTQIAYMVGINDPRYFSKCFKQYYEMTPTEYKEQHTAKS